jgi:phosphoserine phosphatase
VPAGGPTRSAASSPPAPRGLLTVTGPNRPGIVDRLLAEVARPHGAAPTLEAVDSEQVVMQGRLVLGLVVAARPDQIAGPAGEDALLTRLLQLADDVSDAAGVHVQVDALDGLGSSPERDQHPHRVIVLGQPVSLEALGGVTEAITATGGVVEAIWRLEESPLSGVELIVSGAGATALCAELAEVAAATGADIAVERADPAPPRRRAAGVRPAARRSQSLTHHIHR